MIKVEQLAEKILLASIKCYQSNSYDEKSGKVVVMHSHVNLPIAQCVGMAMEMQKTLDAARPTRTRKAKNVR